MRVSERTRTGLKALLHLAARDGSGSLSAAQIARAENLSAQGLAQILNFLKRRGLVKSVRGPTGGYVLAKKPAEIRLSELLEKLDGKPESWIVNPVRSGEADEASLAALAFWSRLSAGVEESLAGATVKDLVDEARRLRKAKGRPPYTFNI
jgi:Rrf2 family protein